MRARELRIQSSEQLQQLQTALESELLRHVASVSGNAANLRRRRALRKDLARVLTMLKQK